MEFTVEKSLQKGIEAHKAGNVQEADRYYTAILKAQPKHPDANHNIGVLAVSNGKVNDALPFFKIALETNPRKAQFWLSYIDALIKLDRKADAKAVFDQAKSKGAKGDDFDKIELKIKTSSVGFKNKAKEDKSSQFNILDELKLDKALKLAKYKVKDGLSNEAKKIYQDILKKFPKNKKALYGMKILASKTLATNPDKQDPPKEQLASLLKLYNQQKLEQVFNDARTLTKRYSKSLTLWNLLGASAAQIGKLDDAIFAFEKALSIKPNYAEGYNNLGNALKEQGKLEEAIEAYNKALSLKPDYAEAFNNTIDLLKTYSPKSVRSHNLFNIDDKIKKLSPRILNAASNREIIDNLAVGLSYITNESFEYKTPLSQIYKRNDVDLNCKRHTKIFDTKDIIPEFCFDCFKVQVEVPTVIDLVKLTALFYKFDFDQDLTKKTIIELRPNISGYYKGLIYCNGLDKANAVKILLDISLRKAFDEKTISIIKRGCSEYPLKFPSYGEIPTNPKKIMSFPKEWKQVEKKFDQDELIEPKDNIMASLPEFCLSDFYIIQKWIDYAKGIGDQSIETFNDRPIIFPDIYEKAKIRSLPLNKKTLSNG